MYLVKDISGAIGLMAVALLLLGTWPVVLAVLERRGRLPQHTFLDFSVTNFLAAVLVALTFGQMGPDTPETPNFLTQLTQLQNNWPSVLFAMAGGVTLSLGTLATQYGWAFVGLSVTEVMASSLKVVIGTTLNYFLDGRINKAEILFPGVGCFLIAAILGSLVHASNDADNKEKLANSLANYSKNTRKNTADDADLTKHLLDKEWDFGEEAEPTVKDNNGEEEEPTVEDANGVEQEEDEDEYLRNPEPENEHVGVDEEDIYLDTIQPNTLQLVPRPVEKEPSYVDDDNESGGGESEDDGEEEEQCNEHSYAPSVEHDPKNPPMIQGATYANMYTFKVSLSQHAIKHRFEFNVKKSGPNRYRAYCAMRDKEGCPWWIYATTTKDDSTVMVKKWVKSA